MGAITGGVIGAATPAVLGRNVAGDPEVRARLEKVQSYAKSRGVNIDIDQITVRDVSSLSPFQDAAADINGLTIGNDILYLRPDLPVPTNHSVLAHEVWHTYQWQSDGWQFTASYLSDRSPWEAAAYRFGRDFVQSVGY